jgi:lysophospholipase L1-like esterase
MRIDRFLTVVVPMVLVASVSWAATKTVPCDHPKFGLSPYTWKCTGANADARAEATFPGAYLKMVVTRTATLGLVIDGSANSGCPAPSMPVIEWSIDDGPITIVPLTRTGGVYTLPLADGLVPTESHKLEVYFRAADLFQNRWTGSTAHLRLAGISMDEGGAIAACPTCLKRVIAYGDSVTEGVGVDGSFTSWQILDSNNARSTWVHFVCGALDCEYGQFGSAGQGMVNTGLAVPPLPQTWDHYDATTSRLQNGLLLPEPDYVFCNMGNNDNTGPITEAYAAWAKAVRAACPHARIFCVVASSGLHRDEIRAAVTARNKAGDRRVYFIDVPLMLTIAPNRLKATKGSFDGGHPTLYGQAVLGACVAARVKEIEMLDRLD